VVRSGTVALLWPDADETTPMEIIGPGSTVGLPAAMNGTYSGLLRSPYDLWNVTDIFDGEGAGVMSVSFTVLPSALSTNVFSRATLPSLL
jgi:hypothetical protein